MHIKNKRIDKKMKKYYSITILVIIVITLLQGYNISLQYGNYINKETEKMNSILKIKNTPSEHTRITIHIKMENNVSSIKK